MSIIEQNKLEYSVILEKLTNYCVTDYGKELCQYLKPSSDKPSVVHLLDETSEAITCVFQKKNPPFSCIPNIEYSIKILESNGVLNASSLLELAYIFDLASHLKQYFNDDIKTSSFPILDSYFSSLYTNQELCKKVHLAILDENTISDQASDKLFSIRKEQRKLEDRIKEKLNHFLHSSDYSKYIQESVITIRNDRYVIPIKEEYRSMIKGFIHDISSSGSTVFIEPMSIFELNNQRNLLKSEETIEIEKILTYLSSLFMPYLQELKQNVHLIGTLDFVFAKANYGIDLNAVYPKINDNKEFHLLGARHPLIAKDHVVPTNISLGQSYQTLVITGPNTGGKTVTLKTVGLLTLMACSGLFIPAKEGSSIYVFDHVFADIGDEQSIQESLSTFSSHMSNIIEILKKSTQRSLILLDELGSGTDPIEGSSLAISILERFFKNGSLTIATTHYSEMKHYALVTNGFENASCGFDLENLQPTYQLFIGIPGRSNAFAISKKLGLEDAIIQRANTFINSDELHIEELIKNIHEDKQAIEKEKVEIDKNLAQIETLRHSLEKEKLEIETKKKMLLDTAKQEARKILLDAKEEASFMIQEMNTIYEHTSSNSSKELNQIRNKINDSIKQTSSSQIIKYEKIVSEEEIQIGKHVILANFDQEAIILSLPNKAKEVQVQIGNMKMMIPLSSIQKVLDKTTEKKIVGSASYKTSKSKTATTEINVIGCTVDEAIFMIDKYLDDCSLAKLNTVHIVHGKGTGALRKGIHSFLKTNSHVKSFRLGTFGEGETGVTVVELK